MFALIGIGTVIALGWNAVNTYLAPKIAKAAVTQHVSMMHSESSSSRSPYSPKH